MPFGSLMNFGRFIYGKIDSVFGDSVSTGVKTRLILLPKLYRCFFGFGLGDWLSSNLRFDCK